MPAFGLSRVAMILSDVHNPSESPFELCRNQCSAWIGIGVHTLSESVFGLRRNMQSDDFVARFAQPGGR